MQLHELVGHKQERKWLVSILICQNVGMLLGFLVMVLIAVYEEPLNGWAE